MSSFQYQNINLISPELQALDLNSFHVKGIMVDVWRIDKIHPVISGNKWFKLKYYLKEAFDKGYSSILTFGGAYSNHIIATAFSSWQLGLQSIGIIRGGKPDSLSHTLQHAKSYGMQLEFISREEYKNKENPGFLKSISEKYPSSLIVPEGGAGLLGIQGSREILSGVDKAHYTHILCAVGTGTMFAGIGDSLSANQKLIGVSVLKGMENAYPTSLNREIVQGYHFGGYAKKSALLLRFMNSFFEETQIPTDFVYTGKLFYGMMDMVMKNYFEPKSRLLIIHCGGLQGNESLPPNTLIF